MSDDVTTTPGFHVAHAETSRLSWERSRAEGPRALCPAAMSLVAPARPAASELRGSAGRRKGVLLPACPSCTGQDVKSIGTGTRRPNADGTMFYYYRYACKACGHKWQEAPPHKRHVPAAVRAVSKPRKTYTCPECGEILLNSRVPAPTARAAPARMPHQLRRQFNARARRAQALRVHRDKAHPTGQAHQCLVCGHSFATAYARDEHQRLCTKDGTQIRCKACWRALPPSPPRGVLPRREPHFPDPHRVHTQGHLRQPDPVAHAPREQRPQRVRALLARRVDRAPEAWRCAATDRRP